MLSRFILSFIKVPSCVVGTIESLFRRFLWGGSKGTRKIHWIAWSKIYKDKADGGLGFKILKAFNYALTRKWL